jgi:hypothetical protein
MNPVTITIKGEDVQISCRIMLTGNISVDIFTMGSSYNYFGEIAKAGNGRYCWTIKEMYGLWPRYSTAFKTPICTSPEMAFEQMIAFIGFNHK